MAPPREAADAAALAGGIGIGALATPQGVVRAVLCVFLNENRLIHRQQLI